MVLESFTFVQRMIKAEGRGHLRAVAVRRAASLAASSGTYHAVEVLLSRVVFETLIVPRGACTGCLFYQVFPWKDSPAWHA